ncbi:MAG: FHA domain-containing protein [Ruminococcus sp.]
MNNEAFRSVLESLRSFPAFSIIMSALVIFMVFICVFAIFRSAKEEKRIEELRWDKVSNYMELVDCATGERTLLSSDEVIIGRHGAADIRFPDMSVSRYHAVLCVSNGVWRVIDLGSKSGTYVNGRKVQEQMTLKDRDEIRFGTKAAIIRRRRV